MNNTIPRQPTISGAPQLLARLVDAATAAGDCDRLKALGILESALAALRAGSRPGALHSRLPSPGGLARWQADRVATHIREHIGTRIRIRELAVLVKLSDSHFSRAFKVSFHQTPAAYIMRQRMRSAQDLMLTTGRPLAQIALDCGLADQAHFSRVFRRAIGVSPSLWRRQFEGEAQSC